MLFLHSNDNFLEVNLNSDIHGYYTDMVTYGAHTFNYTTENVRIQL